MTDQNFQFERLVAYQEAVGLVMDCYEAIKQFPQEERFALCDQIRRAAVSVPSNIAEGNGRSTSKDRARFLEIAYGSLMELCCQFEIAMRLGYINQDCYQALKARILHVVKLMSGLRKSWLDADAKHQ